MTGLRNKRKEKGLSQAELGKVIGVSQQVIVLYERGEREPKLSTIVKLMEALECKFEDLL